MFGVTVTIFGIFVKKYGFKQTFRYLFRFLNSFLFISNFKPPWLRTWPISLFCQKCQFCQIGIYIFWSFFSSPIDLILVILVNINFFHLFYLPKHQFGHSIQFPCQNYLSEYVLLVC